MKKCIQCGSEINDNAKFCGFCGAKQQEQKKFCENCGAIITNLNFCENCGAKVGGTQPEATIMPEKQENAFGFDFGFGDSLNGNTSNIDDMLNNRLKENKLKDFDYIKLNENEFAIMGLKNKLLYDVEIPDCVVSIEDSAFENSNITSVIIPESVRKIGKRAFAGSKYLEKMDITKKIVEIGDEAFCDCENLDITIPKTVKIVGKNVTKNTLTEIQLKQKQEEKKQEEEKQKKLADEIKKAEEIKRKQEQQKKKNERLEKLFGDLTYRTESNGTYCITGITIGSKKSEINIPDCATSISSSAFIDNPYIKKITIPSSVKSIDKYAFCDCSGLETVILPDNIEDISQRCFMGCRELTNINLPKNLKNILYNAFAYNAKLTEITIPSGVTTIENFAFSDCPKLTIKISKTQYDRIVATNKYAFYGVKEIKFI